MNKSKFLDLVKNPESIEEKDLTKLEELTSEHPYSQVVHVLNVKAQKSLNKPEFEKALNLAATYIYDRNLLRLIIESPSLPQVSPDPVLEDPEEINETVEEVSDFEWVTEGSDEDDELILETTVSEDEVPNTTSTDLDNSEEDELSDSREEKHAIGNSTEVVDDESPLLEEIDQAETNGDQSPEIEDEIPSDLELEEEPLPASEEETELEPSETQVFEKDQASKSPEETQPELAKDEETAQENEELTKLEDEEPQDSNVQESSELLEQESSELDEKSLELDIEAGGIHAELMQNLNQLQETKQQYEGSPDDNGDPKSRNEQIEIIDNFIQNSPVLSKPNLSADSESTSQADLSKSSTKLNQELVSENLAKIYSKQGKRKDAEKIYKKLITKFPQKKAYFADQIQKLKKK